MGAVCQTAWQVEAYRMLASAKQIASPPIPVILILLTP
jgi:hypothetical protein